MDALVDEQSSDERNVRVNPWTSFDVDQKFCKAAAWVSRDKPTQEIFTRLGANPGYL